MKCMGAALPKGRGRTVRLDVCVFTRPIFPFGVSGLPVFFNEKWGRPGDVMTTYWTQFCMDAIF